MYPDKELSLEIILSVEEPELVLIEVEVTAEITELEGLVLREAEPVIEPVVEAEPVIEPVVEVEPVIQEDSVHNEDSLAHEDVVMVPSSPLLGTLARAGLTMETVCTMG